MHVTDPGEAWKRTGACRTEGTPPSAFERGVPPVCRRCTVTTECRAYADVHRIENGTYGAETGADRRRRWARTASVDSTTAAVIDVVASSDGPWGVDDVPGDAATVAALFGRLVAAGVVVAGRGGWRRRGV